MNASIHNVEDILITKKQVNGESYEITEIIVIDEDGHETVISLFSRVGKQKTYRGVKKHEKLNAIRQARRARKEGN